MSLTVSNLTKQFGKQKAVDNISFSVGKGEILGFLGPNGAGKSTTMKIAAGYLPPTGGKVQVAGYDVGINPLSIKKIVGYLPEHNPLYLDMYVKEFLNFIASVHKIDRKKRTERINEMILLTGLRREQNKKIGALSKGYRQRVGLAQAMIHDPEVLILDEPTSGLDPNQIVEIRALIRHISKNKTLIFSTHIMQEVQALCERVIIIDEGKIVVDDKVENLKKNISGQQVILAEFERPVEKTLFNNIPGITKIETEGKSLRFHAPAEKDIRSDIFRIASSMNLPLVGLNKQEQSMENIFHKLTIEGKTNENT